MSTKPFSFSGALAAEGDIPNMRRAIQTLSHTLKELSRNPTFGTVTVTSSVVGTFDLLGTSNQVTVTNGTNSLSSNDVTLSLPQNIDTGASPTFGALTLSTTPLPVSSGGTGNATLTNHGVLVGAAAGALSITAAATVTGQLLVGASGADPAWATNINLPGTLNVTGAAVLDSTLQVAGTTKIGADVTTRGLLYVYGDATTTDPALRLYNAGSQKAAAQYWQFTANGDLLIGAGGNGTTSNTNQLTLDSGGALMTVEGDVVIDNAVGSGNLTIDGAIDTGGNITCGNDVILDTVGAVLNFSTTGGQISFGTSGAIGTSSSLTLIQLASTAVTVNSDLTVTGGDTTLEATSLTGAKLTLAASSTSYASITLPHGVAPTSPSDGDMWTTTSAVFARINGATVQLAVV